MEWQHNQELGTCYGPNTELLQPEALGTSPVSTMVYIDDVRGFEVHGTFENVFDSFNCEFHCLAQLLLELDNALEELKFPQAFMRRRTWEEEKRRRSIFPEREPRKWTEPPVHKQGLPKIQKLNRRRGRMTSFCVQVITRRNASWQGRIIWLPNQGGRKEAYFRSALELFGLIQMALQQVCETRSASRAILEAAMGSVSSPKCREVLVGAEAGTCSTHTYGEI